MLQMFHLYVAKVDLVFECCSWTHLSQLRACSCWARVHACGRLAASSSLTHLPPKAFGRWRPNIPVPSPNEHQLCSALASPSPFPSPSSQVATARRWSAVAAPPRDGHRDEPLPQRVLHAAADPRSPHARPRRRVLNDLLHN
jgi:hypothetical protein